MATNFPTNPSNGDTHSGFTYNSTVGAWESSAVTPPDAVIVYATVNDLPTSGITTGQQAFVSATNRLYIWNSSGWYNIALINTTPSISGVSSSYALATDGTATTVTITATDPEGLPITYSIASDTSGNTATVTQGTGANTNVFTITPSTNGADAGTFSLTFRASDGVNIASAISEFTLQFKVANSQYTSALITSVGTNNQVNNDFVDSSANSHTITVAGNVTQSTFSPYRHGGSSVLFPGGDQDNGYLNLGAAIVPATGSWTYQSWIRVTKHADSTDRHSLLQYYRNSQSGRGGIEVKGHGETNPGQVIVIVEGMTTYPISTSRVDDSQWHHVAVERDGNVWSVWIDGVRESQETNSVSVYTGENTRIGSGINTTGTNYRNMNGEMRDVRFSNSARYSGAATIDVPTEDEANTTGYSLLCCQSINPFVDKTGTRTISKVESTSVPIKQVGAGPYDYETYTSSEYGASGYFSGLGDHISGPSGSGIAAPGSGDFCIEFWIYPTIDSTQSTLIDYRPQNSSPSGLVLLWRDVANKVYFFANGSQRILADDIAPTNAWTHVALVRNSGTHYLYINGKQQTTTWADSTTWGTNSSRPIFMQSGYHYSGNSPGNYYNTTGHMADARIVVGSPVYTTDFTPPTAPLTAITNTSLLVQGTNAGIIDKSQSVKTITLNGDVKSSTTQSKYLTSSIYFDGTGDSLTFGTTSDYVWLHNKTTDYTIEFWMYAPSDVTTRQCILETAATTTSSGIMVDITSGTARLNIYRSVSSSLTTSQSSSASISTGQWHHVAFSVTTSDVKTFVDGTLEATTSWSLAGSSANSQGSLSIGGSEVGSVTDFTGYLSDVRITKGLARYTANFTPPTAALKG